MALTLKLNSCFANKCTKLRVYDSTGIYSAENTTGWGLPNLELSSITSATLEVTPPNTSVSTNFDVTTSITSGVIVDGIFLLDEIVSSELDSGSFVDGIYKFVYTVTDGGETYTSTAKTFSTCKADCCVEKMKAKFKKEMCGCNWLQYWDNYRKAEALLYAAKSAFACDKEDKAEDLLNQVNKICSIQKCCC